MQGSHAGECEKVIAEITDHEFEATSLYILCTGCSRLVLFRIEPLQDLQFQVASLSKSPASGRPASLRCWSQQCKKRTNPEMQAFLATMLAQHLQCF